MVTRWFWVRHGPTHQKAFTGWRDVPADLSDSAAIERLNAFLPAEALIISSDLDRAVTTADRLSRGRNRLPHDPDIREFDFGIWDGLHFTQVAERDPDLSRSFWENPGDIAAPEGESWNAVERRTSAVVDRLMATHKPRDIIAVAHMGTIMTQIARAGNMTPYKALGHVVDPLSVTCLIHENQNWRIERVNHLP